jgi:hypothetical protein
MCNNSRVNGGKPEMTMDELQRRFTECEERIARIWAEGDKRRAELNEGRAEMRALTRETRRRTERFRAETAEMRRRA